MRQPYNRVSFGGSLASWKVQRATPVSLQPEMDILDAVASVSAGLNLQLKDKQKEAIQRFCEGHDIFVSLPTGYGKSVIYGIVLPLVFDRLRCRLNCIV